MRLLAFALLALLLAPSASASDGGEGLSLRAEPVTARVMPLSGAGEARLVLSGPCGAPVDLRIVERPAYADAVVSPASLRLDGCGGNATLSVRFGPQAPAFVAQEIVVEAKSGSETASATVLFEPDYFSILDVQASDAMREVPPRGTASFPLGVANLGNGAARVAVELVDASPGLNVTLPEGFVLAPPSAGADDSMRNLTVEVRTQGGAGWRNEAGVVTVAVRSWSADDPTREGDRMTVSFVVTEKGFDAPAPGLLPLLALALCVALAARRASRRA